MIETMSGDASSPTGIASAGILLGRYRLAAHHCLGAGNGPPRYVRASRLCLVVLHDLLRSSAHWLTSWWIHLVLLLVHHRLLYLHQTSHLPTSHHLASHHLASHHLASHHRTSRHHRTLQSQSAVFWVQRHRRGVHRGEHHTGEPTCLMWGEDAGGSHGWCGGRGHDMGRRHLDVRWRP